MKKFTDTQTVWIYPSENAAWHFASVDKAISQKLRETFKNFSRGFGSLPVTVTVGNTTWDTSIFFDTKSGQYLLPLKAEVRRKENIRAGEKVDITCLIRA